MDVKEAYKDFFGVEPADNGTTVNYSVLAFAEHFAKLKAGQHETIVTEPEHEFEALVEDEDSPFEVGSWVPVTRDRIKDINKIDEYIEKGLLRRVR